MGVFDAGRTGAAAQKGEESELHVFTAHQYDAFKMLPNGIFSARGDTVELKSKRTRFRCPKPNPRAGNKRE
jgi:hypothetical protein